MTSGTLKLSNDWRVIENSRRRLRVVRPVVNEVESGDREWSNYFQASFGILVVGLFFAFALPIMILLAPFELVGRVYDKWIK